MIRSRFGVGVLGVLVGGLLFWVGTCTHQGQVGAQMAGGAGDIVAVSAVDNTGFATLFVVDVKARHLAVYKAESSSRKLRLVNARNIDWDLQIPTEYPPREVGNQMDPSVKDIKGAVLKSVEPKGGEK